MADAIEIIPSAKRVITSLRDMGYDFAQAVADVIDNAIEAKASVISVDVEFNGDESWVRIFNNGNGMTPAELREAMRYGSSGRDYGADDLGKFGLGLKTASLSQCRRLSVASRHNPDRADISAYSWDLEHIERTDRWEILPVDGTKHLIRQPLKESTGTVVLWERLDRILGYKHPYGEMARKRLSQTCREIEMHLRMVFHKFLDGEARRRPLKIYLNSNPITPWDPFCRQEKNTRQLQSIRIPVEYEGISGEVLVEPFVLPPQDDFSTLDAFREASGPQGWNLQQGLYIYRAGRMIQSGGWSNLRNPDEHLKLARVAVSFSPELDEAFKINVAKMRVQLPVSIRDDMKRALASITRIANEVYRKKQINPPPPNPRQSGETTRQPIPTAPYAAGGPNVDGFRPTTQKPANAVPNMSGNPDVDEYSGNNRSYSERLLTFEQWSKAAFAVANEYERPILKAVLKRVPQD